ncbi:MAG TPA: hypothetical protein VJ698_22215 [Noviherbaspirillum sp.]|uniref:hypothetical protein n=1 Tax=Noviherbaspirillum sp. TaxID=1926288 RepID=UPI002B4A616D|nr:hypothetical protein [Noviherbaspirillum sp.]HJV88201.1 hypothetical protein [Noviherbaspirillum sp.]
MTKFLAKWTRSRLPLDKDDAAMHAATGQTVANALRDTCAPRTPRVFDFDEALARLMFKQAHVVVSATRQIVFNLESA